CGCSRWARGEPGAGVVRRKAPAGTPALRALQEAGVEHVVREYTHDPSSGLSYGLEAAQALGVDPARVFKTLVAEVDGGLVVAVAEAGRGRGPALVSAGRRGADVGLGPRARLALTGATTARVGRR